MNGWAGAQTTRQLPLKVDSRIYIIAAICVLVILAAVPLILSPGVSAAGDIKGRVIGCNGSAPAHQRSMNYGARISRLESMTNGCAPNIFVDMPPDLKKYSTKSNTNGGRGKGLQTQR